MRSLCRHCWMLLSERREGPGRWVGQDLADSPLQLLGLGARCGIKSIPFQLDTPKPTSSGFVNRDRLLQSWFRNSI